MNDGARFRIKGMRLLLPLAGVVALACSCASIGRPEGGPRDETPPVFLRSNPAPGTTRFSGTRIEATFDENIKLEDIMKLQSVAQTDSWILGCSMDHRYQHVLLWPNGPQWSFKEAQSSVTAQSQDNPTTRQHV